MGVRGLGFHTNIQNAGGPGPRTTWRDNAACRDVDDPELFWPISAQNTYQIENALDYCRRCPVKAECIADLEAMPAMLRRTGQVRAGRYWGS